MEIKNNITYNILKELSECKFIYDSTINDCISYFCFKKKINLSEEEKQNIFIKVKAALEIITKEKL